MAGNDQLLNFQSVYQVNDLPLKIGMQIDIRLVQHHRLPILETNEMRQQLEPHLDAVT